MPALIWRRGWFRELQKLLKPVSFVTDKGKLRRFWRLRRKDDVDWVNRCTMIYTGGTVQAGHTTWWDWAGRIWRVWTYLKRMHALGIGLSGEGKSRKGEQPPNPSSPGKMAVKNGVYTALHLAVCLVWSAAPRCWHHIKTPSPVVDLLWTGHPSVATCNRRWSVICCCWPQAQKHSDWGHYICAVSTGVSTKTEDAFVSAILSGHYVVACLACCARWSLKLLLRPP